MWYTSCCSCIPFFYTVPVACSATVPFVGTAFLIIVASAVLVIDDVMFPVLAVSLSLLLHFLFFGVAVFPVVDPFSAVPVATATVFPAVAGIYCSCCCC